MTFCFDFVLVARKLQIVIRKIKSKSSFKALYILHLSQKECRFRISDSLFDHLSYSIFFCINIIYFVMTYFIIRDTLIMICSFYNLHNFFELDKQSNTISKSKKRHSFWDIWSIYLGPYKKE
jgi:hypothetical protein